MKEYKIVFKEVKEEGKVGIATTCEGNMGVIEVIGLMQALAINLISNADRQCVEEYLQ